MQLISSFSIRQRTLIVPFFADHHTLILIQGDHSPGKPAKVREFQSAQGKDSENKK